MTGSSAIPHLNFPTFRQKSKSKGISNLHSQPYPIPHMPSFGLFLPTPIPASSSQASPYLTYSPAGLPIAPHPTPYPHFPSNGTRATPPFAQAATTQHPRYQLYEPNHGHDGACGDAGWMPPLAPASTPRARPLPSHPIPNHPNPFPISPRQLPPSPQIQRQIPPQFPSAHLQPGQVLATSSTAYCRQITEMANPSPTSRPLGPRRVDPPSHPMHRGSSSNHTSYSSTSSGATDLRRRSALKSLPPSRSSTRPSRYSTNTTRTSSRSRSPTQHIIPTQHLVDSPPQAEFIPDISEDSLCWQPETEEDDEARAVWRRLEMKMGRRMHSGLQEQRGRWVVTPAASPMSLQRGGVDMSPGQFTVSDYMMFGNEAEENLQDQLYAMDIPISPIPQPQPQVDIRRSRRTKSRRVSKSSSKSQAKPPSALDSLDNSLFPTFPISAPKAPLHSTPKSTSQRQTTTCRLDTHVVSALEALQSNWVSPDLDLALLGDTSAPATPTPARASRPLPLPQLVRRAASPPDHIIATPPPLPRLPLPPSPLERGLGLGMSLGTTYNLPSKPTPLLPARPTPSRKSTRPLPSPVQSNAKDLQSRKSTLRGLSRKSTVKVERSKLEGMFVIRDLDTGEACEVGMEGLEEALAEMASRA